MQIYIGQELLLRGLEAWLHFLLVHTNIAYACYMWFCTSHYNHMTWMTSFGHVLAFVSYFLLLCSFAATGEAILTANVSKAMLGDFSVNRRLTNTEQNNGK